MRRKGVRLWGESGELRYKAPKGVLSPEDIERLRECSRQIVELIQGGQVSNESVELQAARTQLAPLSFSQLAHWQVFRLAERVSVRPLASAQRLRGPLQVNVLRMCLADTIRRHAALRTRIVLRDGIPMQEIRESQTSELKMLDLSSMAATDHDRAVRQAIDQLILEPIHVLVGPLFELRLVKLLTDEHVLIVAMEHMISDAFSVGILLRDLLGAYAQRMGNDEIDLPQVTVQFPDYAIWLRSTHRTWLEKHDGYWSERLRAAGRVRFPDVRSCAPESCRGWEAVPLKIERELKEDLREWSRLKRTTLVMSIFSAYCALVLRWCNVSEAVLRYQTDGRMSHKIENSIGYFATVLHLRVQLLQNDTFVDLLQRVTSEYCRAYEHADFSYIDAKIPKPEFAFNSCFNWVPRNPQRQMSELNNGTLTCDPIPFPSPSLRFYERDSEPVILLYDIGDEVVGGVHFPVNRFPRESMEGFARNFILFLQRMTREPGKAVPRPER